MKPTREMFGRIIRVGAPSFAEGISMWGVNLFVLGFIGTIIESMLVGDLLGSKMTSAHAAAYAWQQGKGRVEVRDRRA